jgi:hypothetical protein
MGLVHAAFCSPHTRGIPPGAIPLSKKILILSRKQQWQSRQDRYYPFHWQGGWDNHEIQYLPQLFSLYKDSGDIMDRKKIRFLPGILIILVLLLAGCTGIRPAENTTERPTVSPVVIPTTPAPLPVTEIVTPHTQPPETTPAITPVPEPVVTLTTKPIPPPTISSIYVYGANFHVFPLSFDSTGVVTKGNITLSGLIDSLSSYPLKVVMRGEMYGAHSLPDTPKATAYDTVLISPHGTSGFTLEMDDYVFNDWPGYAVEPDTWNLTIMNVSVASP